MIKGSIVALMTPFTDEGVDEPTLTKLVDWHVEQGTDGIVPCGTTGESPTLSHKEHMRVVEICVEAAQGRVPVIAGAGSNSTTEAIHFTQHAKKAGADAVLSVSPYYNKPTQAGIIAHFTEIAHAVSDMPIILYNIPGRSVIDITPETMGKLAKIENIIGVKDATSDMGRIKEQADHCGSNFLQLSAEDGTALAFNKAGGKGCISVSANLMPAKCARFQQACLEGDMMEAEIIDKLLQPLHQALFLETSPAPLKAAAEMMGLCKGILRLPLVPVESKTRKILAQVLKDLGAIEA
ncbi:MAG: 4-hydroxy-tetrahydrodipicolinate synthase [Parvibaculales bacterium]